MGKRHYDVRLFCLESGKLEATEDVGYLDVRRAQETCDMLNEGAAFQKYRVVTCCDSGTSPIHDVDLAVFRHYRYCRGIENMRLDRYVGEPIPFDWER